MVGKAISTDVETGSTRLQSGGQISYLEYLNCLPEENRARRNSDRGNDMPLMICAWYHRLLGKGMLLTDEGKALNFNMSHLTLGAAENGVDETHILDCTLRETRSMSGNTSYTLENVDLPLASDCRDSEGNVTPEVAHLIEVYKRNDAERELVRERKRKLEVFNSR